MCACGHVCSVMSDSLQPHGLWPARLLCPLGSPDKNTGAGLPCPPPVDLPNPGIEPTSPTPSALQEGSLLLTHQGRPRGDSSRKLIFQ